MADEYKNRKTRKEKEVKKKKQMKAALIAIICFVVVTAISIAAILIVKKVQDGVNDYAKCVRQILKTRGLFLKTILLL